MPLQRIPGAMVSDSTITSADVQDGSLTGADVQDGSIASADVQDGSLTGTDIQDGSIQSGDLAAGAAADIQIGTLQTTLSGTFKDLTGIPSWARRVTVVFRGVSTNGTAHLLLQLGTGGVPTATGYVGGTSLFTYASGILNTTSTAGIPIYSNLADYAFYGSVQLDRIETAAHNWVATGTLLNSVSFPSVVNSSGAIVLANALDMVRLTTTTGTPAFDAGSVGITWE